MTKEKAQQIVSVWLDQRSCYANERQLDAYMNLVSRQVALAGIPGIVRADYATWRKQSAYDFEHQLTQQIRYESIDILHFNDTRICFRTNEAIQLIGEAHHQQNYLQVEIILETDNCWRVAVETVLAYQQTILE